jgi:thioredoxin 1
MENVTAEKVKQLQAEGKKVLVDYWATWCGPCRQLIPRLEKIESEYPDITFVKVDVDQNQDYAMEMGIRGVPTVMIYNGEELLHRSSGVQPDPIYKNVLNSL